MKKVTLCLWITIAASSAYGQLSSGGFPLSVREKIITTKAPIHTYMAPDWEQAQKELQSQAENGALTPYTIGLLTAADVRFPEAGSFTYLPDGRTIWRAVISVEGAPAIGFYYDTFHLPEGVSYFISNGNGRHILGAYTSKNNQSGMFANEALQGGTAMLEIDIAPGVNASDISLHIDQVAVYYTAVGYLEQYAGSAGKPTGGEPDTTGLEGNGSTCHINATCPLGWNYSIQRRAALQILTRRQNGGISVCSATMLNNTGNTPEDCTQYVLSASHCEGSNSSNTDAAVFQQMLLRFNFENPNCNNPLPATVHTLSGVDLVARSYFTPPLIMPAVNGDFLLLKPKQGIPADWEVNLNGWNRADSLPPVLDYPKRYMGFHHPYGDIKKVTTYKDLDPMGDGGGSDGPGTHWQLTTDSGRVEQGSSGHGMIDGDGFTVGVASLAGNADPNCKERVKGSGVANAFTVVRFSKFSYVWDYMIDGDTAFRKLKPWLDPVGSGAITLNPVSSTCGEPYSGTPEPVGIRDIPELEKNVVLYPNPSTTGIITLGFNFNKARNIQVDVYNIAGALLKRIAINNVSDGSYSVDLSGWSNGVYLFRIGNENGVISRKVTIYR